MTATVHQLQNAPMSAKQSSANHPSSSMQKQESLSHSEACLAEARKAQQGGEQGRARIHVCVAKPNRYEETETPQEKRRLRRAKLVGAASVAFVIVGTIPALIVLSAVNGIAVLVAGGSRKSKDCNEKE